MTCDKCKGQGIWPPKNTGGIYPRIIPATCIKCKGTGEIESKST